MGISLSERLAAVRLLLEMLEVFEGLEALDLGSVWGVWGIWISPTLSSWSLNVPRGSIRVVHSCCSIVPSSQISATPAVSSAFSATSAFAS